MTTKRPRRKKLFEPSVITCALGSCELYYNLVWVIRHYFTWILFSYLKLKVSGWVTLMCVSTVPHICREDCTYIHLARVICSWS
jgi:hypothetical protein